MARHKEFNREKVIDKAMQLFWQRGYDATSVEDLVQCTGIGRGSLYDTFGDKHSLYLLALEYYQQKEGNRLIELRNKTGPAREVLRQFFQSLIEEAVNDPVHHGCFMVNTAIELSARDAEIASAMQAAFNETEEAFYHVLIKGQAAGEIPWTSDPHQLARGLLNALLGLRVLARFNPERRLLEDSLAATLRMLD